MPATYRLVLQDLQDTAERYAALTGAPTWVSALIEPGFLALAIYRLTHWLHGGGLRVPALLLARHAQRITGIDLHPGARLGRRCVLMAGGPIHVGETAVVGDDCVLEAGVMLVGAGAPEGRRHPTLGNGVRVEAGAVLMGEIFLGHDVHVTAGAVVTRDIPDGGQAVGVPGRVLKRQEVRPDPDARAIQAMAERIYHLEEQIQVMAFALGRTQGERWKTRQPEHYGPMPAVEALIDGAGI